MSEQNKTSNQLSNHTFGNVNTSISGNVSGQVAIGNNISQIQRLSESESIEVTPEDLIVLKQLFEELKVRISSEVEPSKQSSALERINELQETMTPEKIDLTTIKYVKQWFMKSLPKISGAVTSVIIHPIVGKLVEASGDVAAEEFRRRFQP